MTSELSARCLITPPLASPADRRATARFRRLQVLGPFHSGTNLTFAYQEALFTATSTYNLCFWKHSLPPEYRGMVRGHPRRVLEPEELVFPPTLFLCTVRSPYYWLLSTVKEPYALRFGAGEVTASSRLRAAVDLHGRSFPNLAHVWNAYASAFLEELPKLGTVRCLRLEDLVLRPAEALTELAALLEWREGADLEETIERVANRPAKVHGGPCVHGEEARRRYVPEAVPDHFTADDLSFVNEHLDRRLLEIYRYPVVEPRPELVRWEAPSIVLEPAPPGREPSEPALGSDR